MPGCQTLGPTVRPWQSVLATPAALWEATAYPDDQMALAGGRVIQKARRPRPLEMRLPLQGRVLPSERSVTFAAFRSIHAHALCRVQREDQHDATYPAQAPRPGRRG